MSNENYTHTRRHSNPHINHHRHSTMTQPCHKDTTLNQQCCDSEHTEGWDDTRERDNTKTGNTTTHTTPALQQDRHATTRGDTDVRREGQCNSTRLSIAMPPRHTMPPRHPQCPHPPPRMGEGRRRIPHRTKTTDEHTPTHTTAPGNGQYTIRQQYSVVLQWDE